MAAMTHIQRLFDAGADGVRVCPKEDPVNAPPGMGGRVTKWRDTYVYSADWMSVTGSEEVETDGINWTSFTVKGTKSGRPD